MTGVPLANGEAPDSLDVLPALLGESQQGRAWLIEDSIPGNRLALREGDWKLLEAGGRFPLQLFNLKDDIGEKHNLAADKPEIVERLGKRLGELRHAAATRPQS